MFAPYGGYGGQGIPVSPAFSVTPFVTVQATLIGNDLIAILPSLIYPRKLLGINYTGPSNATAFEVYMASPTLPNRVTVTNQVTSDIITYASQPLDIPQSTQVYCIWRNAVVTVPIAATIAEVVFAMSQTNQQSVVTSAGTQAGDYLYAFHYDAFMNTNGEPVNMNPPSGTIASASWLAMASSANGANASGNRLWRAITVTPGAHIVRSNQLDGSSSNGLIVVRAQNVFFDAAAAFGVLLPPNGNHSAPDIGGGVGQADQDWVFRHYSLNNGIAVPTPHYTTPAGYTLRADQTRSFNDEQTLFSRLMTSGAASIGTQIAVNDQAGVDAYESLSLIVRGQSVGTSQPGSVTFQMAA